MARLVRLSLSITAILLLASVDPVQAGEPPRVKPGKVASTFARLAEGLGGRSERLAARLRDKGHKRTAALVERVAGRETLRKTSGDLFGAFTFGLAGRWFNASAGTAVWSGSVDYYERGVKDVIVNPFASINTPVLSADASRLGKLGGSFYGLPLLSGFKDQRSYGVYAGIFGLLEVGLGYTGAGVNRWGQKVAERGPLLEFSAGVGIFTLGFGIHSPMLQPITRYLEKPAAWLDKQGRRYAKWLGRKLEPVKLRLQPIALRLAPLARWTKSKTKSLAKRLAPFANRAKVQTKALSRRLAPFAHRVKARTRSLARRSTRGVRALHRKRSTK